MLRISSTNLASGNFLYTFGKRWRRDGKMFTVMSFGPESESRYITSCQNTIKRSMARFPHLSSFRRNSTYMNRATEKYIKLRNREHPMQKSGRQRDGNKAASILNCHMALNQNDPNRRDEKQIHSGKTKSLTLHTDRKTPSRRLLNDRDDVEDSSASSSEKTSHQTDGERFKTLEQIRNTIKINSNFKMLNSEEMQRPATGMNQARMKVRRLGTSKVVSDNEPSDKADKAFTQFQKMLEVPVSAQMEQFLHEQEIRKKCAPKTKRRSVNVFKVSDPYVKQRLLKNKVNVEIYNQTHLLNEKEPQCEFAEVQCGKKKLYIAFLDDDLSSSEPQPKNSTGSSPPTTQRKKSGKSLTNKFMHMTSSQRAKVTPEKMAKIIQDSSWKKGKIMKMIEKLPKAKQGKQRSGGHDKTLKFRIPHKEKNMKVIVNLTKDHNEKSLSPPVIHLLQKTKDGSVGEVLKFQIRKIEKYWFPTDNGRIKIQYLTGALSSIKNKLMDEIPRMLKPQTVLEQDHIYQNYRQEDDDFYSSPLVKPLGPEMSTGEEGMTGKQFRATKPLSFKRGEKEEPCFGKGTECRTFFRATKDASKVNRALEEKKAQDNTLESIASRKFISFENLFHRMGVKSMRDKESSSEVKNRLVFQNELRKSKSPCRDMPLNTTDLQSRKLPKVAQPAFKDIGKISKEQAELSQAPPPQLLDPYFAQVNRYKIGNAAHLELECPAAPPVKHQPQLLENNQQLQSISMHPCKLNSVLSGSQSRQTIPRQTDQFNEPEQQHESEVLAVDTHAQVIPSNLQRQNASKQWISPLSTIPLTYNHENALSQFNHPSQNWIPQNHVEYHQPKEGMQSQQQHSNSSQQSDKAQPEVQTEQCGGEQQEKPEDLSYQENSPRPRSKDFYYPKITSRKLKTSRLPAPTMRMKMNEVTNFSSMFEQEHKLIPFNAEIPPIYLNKDIQTYDGLKETDRAVKNVCNEQATISVTSDNNSSIDKNWETWKKKQNIPNLRNMIRRNLANSDVVHSFIIETDTLGECYSAANKLQEFVPKTAVEYNCKYDQEPELKTLENAVAQNFTKISDLDIIQLKDAIDWEKKSCDTRQTSLPAVKADSYTEIAANSQSFVDAAADAYVNGALTVSLDQYQASGSGYSYQVQTKVTSWEDSFESCNSLLEPHVQEAVRSEGQYQKNLLPRKLEDDVDTITTTRTVQPSEIAAILNEEVMDPMSRSKSSKSTSSTPLKRTIKTATLPPWQTSEKIHFSGATFKSSAAACAIESIPAENNVRDNISENITELGAHIEKKKETDATITEKSNPIDNPTSADGSDPLKKQEKVVKSDPNVKPTELFQNLKEESSSRLKSEWNIKDYNELTENLKPLVQTQISPEKRNNRLLLEKFASKRKQTEVNKQTEVAENLEDYSEKDIKKVLRGQEAEDLKLYHKLEMQSTMTNLEKNQLDKSKQRDGGCYYSARYGCEKKVTEPLMVGEELFDEQNLLAVTQSSINTREVDQSRVLALEESSSAITMNQKKSDSGVTHLPRKDHPYLPSYVDPPQRETTFTPPKPKDKDHPYLPNWETDPRQPSKPPQQPQTYPYYYAPPNTEPHPSHQPQHPQQPSYHPQQPETQPPQQPPSHPYYQQPQTQPYYHPQNPHTHPYYQQPQTQPHYQPHTRPNYQPQQPQTNPGQQPPKHDRQEQSPPTRPTDANSYLDQTDRNLDGVSKCDLYSPEFQVEGTTHILETGFGKNMECAAMQEMEIDEYNLLGEERHDGNLDSHLEAFDVLVSITQDGEDLGNVNNHELFKEFKPDVMREEKKFVQSFVMEPKYRKPGKYTDDHKKFKAVRGEDEEKTKSDKAGKIKLKELPPAKTQVKKRSEIKTFEVTLKGGEKSVDDSKKSEAGDKASELMQAKTNQESGKGESKKEVAANREGDAKQQKEADGSKNELRNLGMKKEVEEKQEDGGVKRKLGMKLRKEKEVAKDLESRKKTPDTLQEKTRPDALDEMKRQEEQTKLEQKQREIEQQRALERRKMEEERRALQIRKAEEAKRKAIEIFGYGTREHEEPPKTEPSKGEPPKVQLKNAEKLETSPVIPVPNEKKPEDTKDKVVEEKKIKFPSPEGTSEKKTAGKLEQSNAADNPVKNATMKEKFGPGLSKKLKSLLEERIEKHSTNVEKKIGEPKKPEEAIKISDEEKNRIKTPAVDKKVHGGETKKTEKEGLKSEVKTTAKEELQKTEIKTSKPVGKAEEERKNELGKRKSNLADWEKEVLDKTTAFFRLTAEPEKLGEGKKSAETEKAKKPEEKSKEKLAKSEVSKSDSSLKIDKDNKPEKVPKILPDKSEGDTSSDKSPKMAFENDSLTFTNIEPNQLFTYRPPEYEESSMVAPVTLCTSTPTVNLDQYNNDQFNFAYKGDSFSLYLDQEEWEEMLKLFEKSRAIPAETPREGGNKEQDVKVDGDIDRYQLGSYDLAHTVEKRRSQHRKNTQEVTEGGFGEFTKGCAKAQNNIMNYYQSPCLFTNEPRLSGDVHCFSQKTTNNTISAEYAPINEIYANPTLEQMNIIPMRAAEEALGGSQENAQTSESDSSVSLLMKVFENDKMNNERKDAEAIANDQTAPEKTFHLEGMHQQELRSCIENLKNIPSSKENEKKLIMERKIPVGTEGVRSKKEIAESELNPYEQFLKITTTKGENEMNQTNTENMQRSNLPGKDMDFKLFIEILDRTIANYEKEIRTGGIIQDEQNAKERSGVDQPELSSSEEVKKNYQLIRFLHLIRGAMDATQNEMNQKWNSKGGAGDRERNFDSFLAALKEAKGKSEQKGLDNPSCEAANTLNKKIQKSNKSENQQYNSIETVEERKGKSPRETEQKGEGLMEQQDLTDRSNEGETKKIIGKMVKKEEMLSKKDKSKVEKEKEAKETKKSGEVEKFKPEFNTSVSENQPITGEVRMAQLDVLNVEEITEKKKATKGQKITEEEKKKVITTKVSPRTRAQEVAAKKRGNRLKLEELEEKVKRREMKMNSMASAFTVPDKYEESSESFKVHNVEIIVEEPTTVRYDTSENAASANMAATVHESQEETGVKEFTVREEPFDIEVVSIGQRPTMATVTEQTIPERAVRPMKAAGKWIARTIIPNVTSANEVRSARNYSVREEEDLPVQPSMKETEELPKTNSMSGKAPTGSRKTALKIIGSFMLKRDLQTLSNADIYSLKKESRIPNRPVMLKLLTNKSNEERPAGKSALGESLRNRIASLPFRKTQLAQPEKKMATVKDNTELKVVRVVQRQQEGIDGASKKSKEVPCAVAVDPENSTPERQ